MSHQDEAAWPAIIHAASSIAASYLNRNELPVDKLPEMIRSVFGTVSECAQIRLPVSPQIPAIPSQEGVQPAVDPLKSVFPDYIICLEDGKQFKTMKRHLQVTYNMTPEEYRRKWGLPTNYPVTCPNYATKRSKLALASGLGRNSAHKPKQRRGGRRRSVAAAA